MDEELLELRKRRMTELQRPHGPSGSDVKPVALDASSLESFVKEHKIAIVDVWAIWCGPCRMMEPIVDELASELAGRVGVGKVDADRHPDLVMQYGVQGIPTFLFFKDGALAGRLIGARPKEAFLEAVCSLEGTSPKPDPAFE